MNKLIILLTAVMFLHLPAKAQSDTLYDKPIDELYYLSLVVIGEDTIPYLKLDEVPIVSTRLMSDEEARAYRKLKRNIIKVYPYARRAIDLLNEIEDVTATIEKKRHRKKYLKKLEKELKGTFKDELKKLSVSQGKVLVKLIERETNRTFYDILKQIKNPVSAFFWHSMSKSYGYDLKQGYSCDEQADMEEIVSFLEDNGIQSLGYRKFYKSKNLQAVEGLTTADLIDRSKKKNKKKNKDEDINE